MREYVSESVQQLARSYVDGQRFTTSSEVLLFSLDLLNAFEKHYQERLTYEVGEAFDQHDRGESTRFGATKEIDQFFDDIMQAGRMNHA